MATEPAQIADDVPEVCPTCGGHGVIPPLKNCAFCGLPFRWQEGRAHKGQYRSTGVIYCTVLCAKAAAQRAYRARLRAAHSDGLERGE